MRSRRIVPFVLSAAVLLAAAQFATDCRAADANVDRALDQAKFQSGVVVVLGLPQQSPNFPIELAKARRWTVYFQSTDGQLVDRVRRDASAAGLLGRQVFADLGTLKSIHLADNLADAVFVAPSLEKAVERKELERVLRPRAIAYMGGEALLTKPVPDGIDEWTHPYHGPDNNPQSEDQLVRGSFRTQFLADPKFSPMPEQTVVAGGRIYKAMGHIAHKANQNAMLNTLLCINAYNGTILWRRKLSEGFLIHRNTMIATEDSLLMGDHESCKVIDGETGKVLREITVPKEITDGPVWKWMALRDGVLYGLVGNLELRVETLRSNVRGLGHWPWGMWKGHDYKDPRTAFGFGRTLVAIDLASGKLLWRHRDEEFLDARAVCMNDDNIYCFSAERFLACIDRSNGALKWRNQDQRLLKAIGPNASAQHYVTGYATTCYMKCNNDYLFFAGPQRKQMVVASATDGSLAWTHPNGNLQLVLRKDGVFAAGPKTTGVKLDYKTGRKIGELPTRRACTRATGCADSIFYRTSGGTVRVMTETNSAQHIAPMRPPCQDGVIVSNGLLYWGPWMCGCQLSLYGNIALGPARQTPARQTPAGQSRAGDDALRTGDSGSSTTGNRKVAPFNVRANDWAIYRGDNARSDTTQASAPKDISLRWSIDICENDLPTAPVAAAGWVFIGDRTGRVQAIDGEGKRVWDYFAAGPVYYPPTVANNRVYFGSADGRVYALEARTGRFLWSHRVAPEDRLIPVYGKLISTWPVAGGVAVHRGVVYAAAGIAHYDGTHVVALDAITGEVKVRNDSSGVIATEVNSGVSMQGNVSVVGDELRFLAGGVYETARYDLGSLRCLNRPKVQVTSQFRTAFYPYYPSYGKYTSLEHVRKDGATLSHDASYEGSKFTDLVLEAPLPKGEQRPRKEAARWLRRRGRELKKIWRDEASNRYTSFVVTPNVLLAAGHPASGGKGSFIAALDANTGKDVWRRRLPADAVKSGAIIDHDGRVYVATENGKLLCFAAK